MLLAIELAITLYQLRQCVVRQQRVEFLWVVPSAHGSVVYELICDQIWKNVYSSFKDS